MSKICPICKTQVLQEIKPGKGSCHVLIEFDKKSSTIYSGGLEVYPIGCSNCGTILLTQPPQNS